MKTLHLFIFILVFSANCFSQNERNLDDTKLYILKVINEMGWRQDSKSKLYAEFVGDYLKVTTKNKFLGREVDDVIIYNFTNVYKYQGPTMKAGDITEIIIWVDYLANEKTNKWKVRNFEIDIHNHELGEQLMIAFKHLNKLLVDKKPKIEKF